MSPDLNPPPVSGEESRPDRFAWLAGMTAALATAAAYVLVFRAGFVRWDDNWVIYKNPNLHGLGLQALKELALNVHTSSSWYTPLSGLRHAALNQFWGLDPLPFHAANVAMHALNAALAVAAIRALLRLGRARDAPTTVREHLAALAGGLIWSLHPLRVEAVAWVSGGAHTQALSFLLVGLLLYLRAVEVEGRRRWMLLAASTLAYAASLLSQPSGLGFVGVLVAVDFWRLRGLGGAPWRAGARRALVGKLPYCAAALAFLAINLSLRSSAVGMAIAHRKIPLSEFGLFPRVMQAFYALGHFAWRPLFPFRLSPLYTDLISFDPWSFRFLAVAAAVTAGLVACVALRKRVPLLASCAIAYVALMAPLLGVGEHPYYPADRYSLFSSLVGSVLLASWLARPGRSPGRQAVAVVASLSCAVGLGLLTLDQSRIWTDTEMLLRSMIERLGDDPFRARIHARLGAHLAEQGRPSAAADEYNRAREIAASAR